MHSSSAIDLELAPSRPAERDDICRFLASTFGVPRQAPFVAPDLADWKFFAPRSTWSGPRSYVMKNAGRIVAHSCIWPVSFVTAGRTISSMHLIDWAASTEVAGAGMLLNRELMKLAETAIGLGASSIGIKVACRIGFERCGTVPVYARVLHPWRQLRSRPRAGWKNWLALGRNSVWASQPKAPVQEDSSVVETASFPESFADTLQQRTSEEYALPVRTVDSLNYVMRCPAVSSKAFFLYQGNAIHGYFLLCRTGPRITIADLWVASPDESAWASALSLAVRNAARDPDACEIAAFGSSPLVIRALVRNHFYLRGEKPILLYDPHRLLQNRPMYVTPLESDAFFLYEPDDPFLT